MSIFYYKTNLIHFRETKLLLRAGLKFTKGTYARERVHKKVCMQEKGGLIFDILVRTYYANDPTAECYNCRRVL